MSVDRSVSRSASQRFVVSIWDVFLCFWIKHPFCEAHVNDMDGRRLLAKANQEVVGLDITVDEGRLVHELKPLEQLDAYHEDSF